MRKFKIGKLAAATIGAGLAVLGFHVASVMAATTPYTMAEVAVHNTATDCWTVVSGQVYNVTPLVISHTGGRATITPTCGVDGTSQYNSQHQGRANILTIMNASYQIGILATATAPGAPTSVTATAGNAQAAVTWVVPASNGGSAITSYTATAAPGGRTCTVNGANATTCTVTGLTNGTAYTFSVRATNAVGASAASAPSASVTPTAIPGVPTNVVATRGDGRLVVTWTAPAANGVTITGYTATASPGTANCSPSPATSTTCTITGLTNGSAYTVTVVARATAGSSAPSTPSAAVIPAAAPSAPTGVAGQRGDTSVTVSWAAANPNGDAITAYTVTSTPGSRTCTTSGLLCTVSGLTNGTAYTFRVVATNTVGDSAASTASAAVTPAAGPTVPGNVNATAGNGQATITWSASSGNGSTVTGYSVTSTPGSLTCSTTSATTCTITGLTNGTSYTFTVIALNAISQSVPSLPSPAVTPIGPPTAPTSVAVVRGDQSLQVTWTASNPNGSPISNYRATASPGGAVCNTTTTSCTISGLTNGTKYTVVVTATNEAGTTSSASSAIATPAALPSVPTNVVAATGDASSLVTWTSSADNGEPITAYTVTSTPGGIVCTSSTNSCLVLPLTNGTAYYFTVTATNAVGTTVASTASAIITPAAGPTVPTNVTTNAGNGSVQVSWLPSSPNGSPITGYTVTSAPGGYSCSTVGATSCIVSGLTNGVDYTFVVIATNAISNSSPSAPSAPAMPVSAPSAPTNVTVVRGDQKLTVSWNAAGANGRTVSGYTVVVTPSKSSPFIVNTSGLSVDITGLTNGENYTFQVYATNSVGFGEYSTATAPVAPGAPPSAPTGVTGTPSDGAIDLFWIFDLNRTNGAYISNFVVTETNLGVVCITTSNHCRITGLMNGVSYTFSVTVNSDLGPSVASAASAPITPAGTPDRPTSVEAIRGDGRATISWIESDGNGAAIEYYVVRSIPGDLICMTTATSCEVSGLNNGVAYTFVVTAKTALGFSRDSQPSAPVTPAGLPTAPFGVVAQRGHESAVVTWIRSFANGALVTEYQVTAYPGGSVCTNYVPSCEIDGLANGQQYMFIVTALNDVGVSAFSAPSPPVVPATFAGTTTTVSAVRGDGSATVTWQAVPESLNGGTAITGYTVRSTPDGITCVTTSTTCVVSGLTNGVSYRFAVMTMNDVGASPASDSSEAVTPAGIPFAPGTVWSQVGNAQLTVSWNAANGNGLAVTRYVVTSTPGGKTCSTDQTTCVITGLSNMTMYTFSVVSESALGLSAPSAESAPVMPSDIPGAPKITKATSTGVGKVLITWDPALGNGSRITKYEVSWAAGKVAKFSPWKSVGTLKKWTSSTWKKGQPYLFKVRATNAVGTKISKTFLVVPLR